MYPFSSGHMYMGSRKLLPDIQTLPGVPEVYCMCTRHSTDNGISLSRSREFSKYAHFRCHFEKALRIM